MASLIRPLCLALTLTFAAAASHAAFTSSTDGTRTTILGFNANPAFTVSGDPLQARDPTGAFAGSWGKSVTNVRSESFDGFSTFTPTLQTDGNGDPLPVQTMSGLSFTGVGPVVGARIETGHNGVTPNVQVLDKQGESVGRYDTTKPDRSGNHLQTQTGFTIIFETAIEAFGTYITDIGDFGSGLQVVYIDENGNEIDPANPITIFSSTAAASTDGSLLFFGFFDTKNKYKGLRFIQTNDEDGLGFDDMVIANFARTNGTPEPGSLALAGLAMVAGTVLRRRRQR